MLPREGMSPEAMLPETMSPEAMSFAPAFAGALGGGARSASNVCDTGFVGFCKLRTAAKNTTSRSLPLTDHIAQRSIPQPLPHDHHHVDGRPGGANPSKCLAHEAFRSIPLDGIADATRRGNAEPWPVARRRPIEHEDKPGQYYAPPPLLDAQELGALPDAITSRIPT